MAFRYGNRHQYAMFPETIDKYVGPDDPVRAYDAMIDAFDIEKLGIATNPYRVGNPSYDPKVMLKLLVYGYSYKWKSSREIERATHHNVSFMWLIGGLKPDHKTISEFRRNNKEALKKMLKHCARLCVKLDLIDGNILFVDGTKIRANAGREKNFTKKHYEELLSNLDERIELLISECEAIDEAEKDQPSFVSMKKGLQNNEQLRNRIKDLLKEFDAVGEKTKNGAERTKNLTDPESAVMRSLQGSHASYNVQSVVDDKHGIIVHADAVNDATDLNQFAKQIIQAEETLEHTCQIACADAGYADTEELAKIDKHGTTVIVPSQRQALHAGKEKPFSKSVFTYDAQNDCYYCPNNQELKYTGYQKNVKARYYRITRATICKRCPHFGVCTSAKKGRKILRYDNESIREKIESQYAEPENQKVYARRKSRVEHPFGHIKKNLGKTQFLIRGRNGAQAETAIVSTCFNIARMITIFGGVQGFIQKISTL